jgi:transcription initiation factor TFIID subunit 1
MMGTHAGALSQERIRTEADLSPSEGMLVLFEYCEERPPIQLTAGMASRIINYFRGDRSRCPISAGGGDRPTRRKRGTEAGADNKGATSSTKTERPSLLMGPNHAVHTSIIDWIGKPPKKQSREDRAEKASVNILPEGVTEILHPKMHGPFIGKIEEGTIQTGLISNLFAAPMFRHEPEETDFLMILRKKSTGPARQNSQSQSLGVVLRPLPSNVFVVGQTEPRQRVHAPNTKGEKDFAAHFISYQIAKALSRAETREGHGLRFDEISDSLFPNKGFQGGALRQRIKQVAIYDKNTSIWTCKPLGFEDYPGVEVLGRRFTPESVAGYETANAAVRRLCDLGIHELFSASHTVASVGVAMVYLAGQVNATRELSRKMKKWLEACKTNRLKLAQIKFYEKATAELDALWKQQRIIYEVAQFIYEELQLTPWNLTGEFIDVHKNAAGTGMMKLTGLGDPSGQGAGFSFIREVDSKPSKSFGAGVNAQMQKITGTENDLRKLSMKQMASILRSYGMAQKQIDTLKRWDRVHVIRDLST